jgi:RecB family exonuclease
VITPRLTRLLRTATLGGFREALVSLCCGPAGSDPLAARHRLVIVPTHAAAAHLLRTVEQRRLQARAGAVLLPTFATVAELPLRLAERLADVVTPVDAARREVLLGVVCRDVRAAGVEPPFQLRPGLVAEALRFYDQLRRNRRDVDALERLVLGILEPGAAVDRGAARLVMQTRFLVAAFREFERRCAERGWVDEHALRTLALDGTAAAPWEQIVIAVGDAGRDPHGLALADWDLLARVPALRQLDVVVTDTMLAGAFHERIHELLPGIEEVRVDAPVVDAPRLRVPAGDRPYWTARDREEEVAGFARWARAAVRAHDVEALDEMALVVRQPLPYVYLAREVLRSGGVPCQTFDALPLAGEPFAAALDLLFSFVSGNFARVPSIALLGSPHFRFLDGGEPLWPVSIAALDRALSDAGYLGDVDALERLVSGWIAAPPARGSVARALPAGRALLSLARELSPLRAEGPAGALLERVLAFLAAHEHLPGPDDPLRTRQLRARGAVVAILGSLRDAYQEIDSRPVTFDEVAGLVRRWIEAHTFAPRSGETGVHLVDAESAKFGDFRCVQLAGLVDGEWPERPRRNVFYSPGILRELGWPADKDRLDASRAAFADLLTLPASLVALSTFTLENDAVVAPSTLLDEAHRLALVTVAAAVTPLRVFEHEALALDPMSLEALDPDRRAMAAFRVGAIAADADQRRGTTGRHSAPAYSLSALERYQDCPFKFFAADVLKLEEAPEDETALSPRARGRFIHEVFQRFFEAWPGPITPARFDEARACFVEVAEQMLTSLPEADAAIERARLFGSAISTGIVDIVLGLEAERPAPIVERRLEYRLEGGFSLGSGSGREVFLKGVADRIDILDGRRLRVVDYKSGSAPNPRRALQVPIYALCAQERLAAEQPGAWEVDEASYIAFTGRRSHVAVVRSDASDREAPLAAARDRLFEVIDGIERGEFPPRPHDPIICTWCAYASVCRKDYVGDE